MSPRSAEFMSQARDRLAIAREVFTSGHREGSVSAAYYAMLYAARAALSEDDDHARTHRGTWNRFWIRTSLLPCRRCWSPPAISTHPLESAGLIAGTKCAVDFHSSSFSGGESVFS